jgi:hypothetical protein
MTACVPGVLFSSLTACTTYYVEQPIPIDASNIYRFPRASWGEWYGDEYTISIKKESGELIFKDQDNDNNIEIYNGIVDSISYERGRRGLGHIIRNRWGVDTVLDYFIKKNKIYERVYNKFLKPGQDYTIKNDTTLIIHQKHLHKLEFKLGEDFFLRKVNKDIYLLNLREGNALSEWVWYHVYLLKTEKDGSITVGQISEHTPDSVTIREMNIGEHNTNTYLTCHWTKAETLKAIDKGFFSMGRTYRLSDKRLDSFLVKEKYISK